MKKAVLMVSFGTSYKKTRERTIDVMAKELAAAFPERIFYQAYTSRIILDIMKKRDGIEMYNVEEALLRMEEDGVTDLIVQPTHILNGIENDNMKETILRYQEKFESIGIGAPLLSSSEDYRQMIEAVAQTFPEYGLGEKEGVVLMGHGTEHYTNSTYGALDYALKEQGLDFVYVATVEAYPSIQEAIGLMKQKEYKKVLLLPFMIVAGEHAHNDMAGDGEDSFKSLLLKEGYEVEYRLKGLGEYKKVRELLVSHAKEAER